MSDTFDDIFSAVEDIAPIALAGAGLYFGAPALFGEAAGGMLGAEAAGWGAADAAATYGTFEGLGGAAAELAGWGGAAMDFGGYGSTAADMAGFGASGGGGFNLSNAMKFVGPAMSIGSGLMGMDQAAQMRKMAALAGKRSDPWGTSGGRGLADQQLQDLMRDPGQVAQNDPAYKLRIQAAQRAMGPMGQGSGAMAVAGANASTDWLNQRMASLGGLAGASGNPGTAESLAMQGNIGANDLLSKSLASIGYGVTRGTGGGTAMPPAVQEWFRQQGYANG